MFGTLSLDLDRVVTDPSKCKPDGTDCYTYKAGFQSLAAGLSCGISGLGAGMAIGIVGDAGVRAVGQQDKLFVVMILVSRAKSLHATIPEAKLICLFRSLFVGRR